MKLDALMTDPDAVLQLLRSLSPRDRLRVVAEVLPELGDELLGAAATEAFWHGEEIGVLAERQAVHPVTDFHTLLGGWPEGEPVDDFLAMLRKGREESPARAWPT